MTSFLLAFIPLFVAIDPIGTIPLFLGLTEGASRQEKRHLAFQAVITALIVGIAFGFGGRFIFRVLGITHADFQIAGGILLMIISVREIFGSTVKGTHGQPVDRFIGVVPLGIPLTAGPAMITTILILHQGHDYGLILAALILNLAIAYLLFAFSQEIVTKLGEAFSKVTAKVVAIFLAAIAIMMIRRGLEAFFVR